nr:hypothetical protein [Tanacetum cinerariifolium]GEY45129.1 hypothetical protein [Tanacetum cinerariifolium]
MALTFADTHNMIAYLTKSDASEGFNQITDFLNASSIQVGKGFSGVDTQLFEGMLVEQQAADDTANIVANDVDDVVAEDVAEPTPPSLPTTTPPLLQELPSTSHVKVREKEEVENLWDEKIKKGGIIADIYADKDVTLEEVKVEKNDEDDEQEPAELQEVIEVVTTAKLMTKVVTAATTIVTVVAPITAATITTAPTVARRRKGVVIRDPEETATPSTIIHSEPKSKDKGKGIMVKEPKPLKKQAQIKQDEAYERDLEEKATKKQKLDEEVEELKKYLQIVPNDDNVYTNATPLALKVPVIDYAIYTENNKPYYKIIIADGSHQLFLCFLSLLRNFDREDLEVLWQLVKQRFASSKPKNFSDDFLLTTLTYMFEKPDVEAQVWKNQRSFHGLAKVKSWRLLESCRVHIITFTSTQMTLLVERRYPLTRFTLEQMLNYVRLEVEEESKVSLELLIFVRKQQQEGYKLD